MGQNSFLQHLIVNILGILDLEVKLTVYTTFLLILRDCKSVIS